MRLPISLRLPVFLVLLCASAAPLRAETPSEVPNPLQTRRSWLADNANVVSDDDERRIDAILSPLERRTTAEVVVVTIHNLGGQSVEAFANDLFHRWGVGKKGKDNGVLILAAIDDRKIWIEIGYGLEDKITDGQAGEIWRNDITPAFKRGDFGGGLYTGALDVAQKIDPSTQAPTTGQTGSSPNAGKDALRNQASPPRNFPVIPPAQNAPTNPSPPATGTESEGFLMFLGFMVMLCPFAVVGGIIWLIVKLVRRPMRCPKCKTVMELIPDAQEAKSLSPIQQFEQQIGSRDYKVWHCPNCQNEVIAGHNPMFSAYENCPVCHNRTARTTVKTLRSATEYHQGLEEVSVHCEWPACGHTGSYNRNTPSLPRQSYSSGVSTGAVIGSSYDSSSSSSSWGSSSSSDSSSSSSSYDSGPSDFGGGDSGGAGSGGSW